MAKIVAIGGGELRQGETKVIDRFIVHLSGKAAPKMLFIPTASYDAKGYIDLVRQKFGELGCIVDTLCLISNTYEDKEIYDKIISSDIIYVGGGDTVRMMEKWRENKLDVYLVDAYNKGIVLSGLSAGSICWFMFGHSDSDSFLNKGQWDYTRAEGLGLIPAAHCPHYNEEGRENFDKMLERENISGIALEDNTAFIEINGEYQILKSDKSRKAYLLKKHFNSIIKTELPEGKLHIKL